jgi:ankyrin repeat protein
MLSGPYLNLFLDESYCMSFQATTATTIIALDINITSGFESNTPWHMTCFQNHVMVVKNSLRRSDIDINVTNAAGRSPIHLGRLLPAFTLLHRESSIEQN